MSKRGGGSAEIVLVFYVLKSFVLFRECAEILESMKQLGEAAQLYEASQYYDKVGLTHPRATTRETGSGPLLPDPGSGVGKNGS